MERTNPPKPRLSENLSSDSLFTFTPKLEYLISMLERGIYPRYICERIPIPNRSWYYTVAAKCFCDIPLGMIKSHLNWFGNYGLGIKKSFLKEQGASPIIYIHNKSRWIVDSLIEGGLKKTRSYPTLPFLKRLNGQDYKLEYDNSYTQKFRTFYDEREWRYIPQDSEIEVISNVPTIVEGIKMIRKKNSSEPYKKSFIKVVPDNIEYIIIDTFNEFKELKACLRNIYTTNDDYELMLSKILIAERIIRDF